MRVFVFGNINAGKSYAIEYLRKILPKHKVIKIDEYRMHYGDGTLEKELVAQDHFVRDIEQSRDLIIEATGAGPLGHKIANQIHQRTDIIIHIKAEVHSCLSRLTSKDFSKIPYPKYSEKIEDTIVRCHDEFVAGIIQTIWKHKVIDIFEIQSDEFIEKQLKVIPWKHYLVLSNLLIHLLNHPSIHSIVSYGSLGRHELSESSDIDMFVISQNSPTEIAKYLESKFNSIELMDIIDHQVIMRFDENKVLIELNVLEHIDQGTVFFIESKITDYEHTIFKSDEQAKKHLQHLANNHVTTTVPNAESQIKRMVYYALSLNKQMMRNDRYKFYFHANILLHSYIRIKALMSGHQDFNYLPRFGDQYINQDDHQLFFDHQEGDMKTYIIESIGLITDLLAEYDRLNNTKYSIKYKKVFTDTVRQLYKGRT